MLKKRFFTLFTSCLALVFVLPLAPLVGAPNQIQNQRRITPGSPYM